VTNDRNDGLAPQLSVKMIGGANRSPLQTALTLALSRRERGPRPQAVAAGASRDMDANLERYSLASIKKTLADGKKIPNPSEVSWLVEECERLSRANRALDREVARLDLDLKQKDAEFSAAEMELLDVSEELSKCRQQLALTRQIEN
jgi:hypothetical protein